MKQITVQVNPNLEYMNSILLTSRYNQITEQYIGYGLMTEDDNEYTKCVKRFFEKHRNDPIYHYIESLIPNGFTFSRPVELMLSLGDRKDFVMQHSLSELCIEYCGDCRQSKSYCICLRLLKEKSIILAFLKE